MARGATLLRLLLAINRMYVLYLDESGTTPESSYFVLGGLAVFEREIYWFTQELEDLQHQYFPKETEPLMFHATKLRVRESEKVEGLGVV